MLPVKSLTAAVTVGLVLSVQSNMASRANREYCVVAVQMDLIDRHRDTERLGSGILAAFCKGAHIHTAATATANGFRS